MSRCFPYPPPGYDEPKQRRSERKDLLKKERHKGKNRRKENGRGKGVKKGKDKGKGERKENDRGHKKLKREKHREKRKNKERDKHNHRTSDKETQKIDGFDNRRSEDRSKHEAVKDIKHSDELVAQFSGQGGHANHKVHCTGEFLPQSSKEKESSVSRMAKKSGHTSQHNHGMVQKNNSIAYTNNKRTDAGVGSETTITNGKNLQVGSREKHSSRMCSSKVKPMEKSGDVYELNKVDDLMHLACVNEQKFAYNDMKKRKELDGNSSLNENASKTPRLPRMSPMNTTRVNGKTSPHSQGIAPDSSAEQVITKTEEIYWFKPQDVYSNGIPGSSYLEQQTISVSSSVYDSNEGHLKPPHPDTKYLGKLQSAPPWEEFPEYIDQDWLFSKDHVERKTSSFEAAESHQVWSDAQLIDTADVVALPYVVPM